MKRRSLFQLLAGAVLASAMEVCGLRETTAAVAEDFSFEAQMKAMIANLEANIVDIWELRHAEEYQRLGGKIICST